MRLLGKLFLILIYPFVYALHPRMRKYHALRLKYWAMERDFFKTERRLVVHSTLIAAAWYIMIWHGIGYINATYIKASHEVVENIREAKREAHKSVATNVEERSKFDVNVVDTTERVVVTAEENAAQAQVIETRKDIKASEEEALSLLEQAKRRKAERVKN